MPGTAKLLVIGLVAITLTACGKSEEPTSTVTAKPAASVSQPSSKPAPTAAKPAAETVTTYRSIKARLRENGEQIDILVPDNMDIESGRMLEYKIGDDGKYYLKSVIPQ